MKTVESIVQQLYDEGMEAIHFPVQNTDGREIATVFVVGPKWAGVFLSMLKQLVETEARKN